MPTATPQDTATGLADDLLAVLFSAEPLWPSMLGISGYDERLADRSGAAEQRLRDRAVELANRADALAAHTTDPVDSTTLAVVTEQAAGFVDQLDALLIEYAITDLYVAPAADLLTMLPKLTLPDQDRAAGYLARLRAIPEYLGAVQDRHREGLAAGRLPVARLVDAAVSQLDRYLADPGQDPLLEPRPPAGAGAGAFDAERARLLRDLVRPAFAGYRDMLVSEIRPDGRPDGRPGLCALPDGETLYARLSRSHTTTTRTPDELHRTGLDLMARLAEEFAEIGSRVFGSTDQREVFHRLRTDPALRWGSGEELLAAARAAIERAEAAAPRWFGRLPEQRCEVRAVPPAEGPNTPAAYYMRPALDGSRPGMYFANTHQATERDRYVSEVTAFHEAVPGHHLQITLASGLTDLPLLRRLAGSNAYAEGWGLYCERLADEMGLYTDDVSRLGMLAMDAVRAGRLVVDTGLHAKGWSRQQALDYLVEHAPMAGGDLAIEVDRYIAYPGQALSYMVGRLEIQRIRAEAERRLGPRFDIRAFHDLVLGGGALPLRVLESVVARWPGTSGPGPT